jgi:pyridoxal phosphate enzyme (YggS family)
MADIAENYAKVLQRVEAAALRSGRNPEETFIIAVTKNQSIGTIKEGIQLGITKIGENRVQELLEKFDEIGPAAQWHLIGHLQRNKVKYVVDKVALIHSLDNLLLAEEINRRAKAQSLTVNVLVQVNVSGEETKYGMEPSAVIPFIQDCSQRLERIRIKGLMTIAPFVVDPEEARPYFKELRELAHRIKALNIPGVEMEYLSMGMTNDFEVAVEEGANLVRIGRAIFGD